ncbi:glycoside hydrolase family 26 protein [Streptomyces anandii]|uniref:glycoside hydrolase family 26 protein n=1 Tax=Streptomyces anandii TaxID=285454 RepID=UPI00368A8D3A
MTSQQCPARAGRLAIVTTAAVVSAALVSGPCFAAGAAGRPGPAATAQATTPAPVTPPPVPPMPAVPTAPVSSPAGAAPVAPTPGAPVPVSSAPAPATSPGATPPGPAGLIPAFGAFLGSGAQGVARMTYLSRWLGGTDMRVGHTYLPGNSWSDIEGTAAFLDVWAQWRRQKADRMLVLNVPMQERNEDHLSDTTVRWLLQQGAAGRFDQHFRALAERLVELKVPDTVLVLGWEMNGTTYTHRCGPDPQAWKKYWNRIVTTMRSVPGQRFRFDFAPSRGRDAVPWTECYPGDDTVDIIGMDAYDQPRGLSFDEQVKEPYGLQAHVNFAKSHHKPISYPEWGLFRNGDNPEYMRRMLEWIREYKPLYNTLTDYCPHGVWGCAANPASSRVYRSLLFGRTDETTAPPTPAPSTSPTAPAPSSTSPAPAPHPAGCSPLDLGDWVEYWLGGKLCVRLDWWSRIR